MKYAFGTAALALALAGCGGSGTDADTDGDGTVTTAEALAENAKDGDQLKPEPGKYKVSMTFVEAEGMPKEMQDIMKGGAGMMQGIEYCLTPEDAENGFGKPPQDDADDSCKMTKYDIEGDQMEVSMVCKDDKGEVEGEIDMSGTVSPTKQDITVVTKGMMDEMGAKSVTMKMEQERIGDCDK